MPIDTSKLSDTLDQLLLTEDKLTQELALLIADILKLRTNTDGATLQAQVDAIQKKAQTALDNLNAAVSQVTVVEPMQSPAQTPSTEPAQPAPVEAAQAPVDDAKAA